MKAAYNALVCKVCGSPAVVRYGTYRGVQRWWCKICRRKFADNEALPGMKTPTEQVAESLSMYYEGMSLNAIRRQLEQEHGNRPSDSTVYGWIERFTQKAIAEAKDTKPDVGDVWVADETVLRIGGKNVWFWDIIDAKTRFLLASHMSLSRTTKDAQTLMKGAAARAGKPPRIVLTDKLQAYLDGVELAYGSETKHVPVKGLTAPTNTNIIERFHGSLKARTKVMRGLKKRDTAQLILDGWLVFYNFFRPHEALKDKTPAEKAGVAFKYQNWMQVVGHTLRSPETSTPPVMEPLPCRFPVLPFRPSRKAKKPTRQKPMGNQIYVGEDVAGNRMYSRRPIRGARRIRRMWRRP